MSEEEKKAIEWLKKADWFSARLYSPTILNLIEKQSKEIEELKNGQIDFWISDKEIEERIRNKFVNKDKIKAKIEEIKNDCKKCRFRGFCKDLLKNNQCSQGEVIKVLNKLLEDKK